MKTENSYVINKLLNSKEASIRYRMLSEYMGKNDTDIEVIEAKQAVLSSKNTIRILSKLDDNGLFPHTASNYGNFTTFNYLTALAELGLTIDDKNIYHIVDWILTPSADKNEHFISKELRGKDAYLLSESNMGSCRQVLFLNTLVKLGALKDDRVKRMIDVFVDKSRFDGGYLCKWKKSRHKGEETKSCYISTLPALLLFSNLPQEYRDCTAYTNLLDYFFSRNMIYSKIQPEKIIADTRLAMFSNRLCDLVMITLAMSKLGYGNTEQMKDVWEIIDKKETFEGFYLLEHTESKKTILTTPVGKPNEWITYYIEIARKLKESST